MYQFWLGPAVFLTADTVCSPAPKENPPSRACGKKAKEQEIGREIKIVRVIMKSRDKDEEKSETETGIRP